MNGCHDRAPFKAEMHVQDGWSASAYENTRAITTRSQVVKPVPFRMAADCRYTHSDLGQADKGCTGCRWKKGEGKRNG